MCYGEHKECAVVRTKNVRWVAQCGKIVIIHNWFQRFQLFWFYFHLCKIMIYIFFRILEFVTWNLLESTSWPISTQPFF